MADITEEHCFGLVDLFKRLSPFSFFFQCKHFIYFKRNPLPYQLTELQKGFIKLSVWIKRCKNYSIWMTAASGCNGNIYELQSCFFPGAPGNFFGYFLYP